MTRHRALFLIAALTLVACSGQSEPADETAADSVQTTEEEVAEAVADTLPTSACNDAFARAASIGNMEDTVEDLDPAVQACTSVADWEAAAQAHPGALDGVAPRIFLRNRCDFGGLTGPLCDEVLGG